MTKIAQLAKVQPASCHIESFVTVLEKGEPIHRQDEDKNVITASFDLLFVGINTYYLIITVNEERRLCNVFSKETHCGD